MAIESRFIAVLAVVVLTTGAAPSAPGTANGPLVSDDSGPIELEIAAGQSAGARIPATAGELVRLRIDRGSLRPRVVLTAPNGELLAASPEHELHGELVLSAISPTNGTCLLRVTASADAGVEVGVERVSRSVSPENARALVRADRDVIEAAGEASTRKAEGRRRALKLLADARLVYRTAGDAYSEARTWDAAGRILIDLGEHREAEAAFTVAAGRFAEIGALEPAAAMRSHLGNVALEKGRAAEALADFELALDLWEDIGDLRWQAALLSNIGNAQAALGEYEATKSSLERSLELRRAAGDRRGEIYTRINLGMLARRLGRPDEAVARIEPALADARALGDEMVVRQVLYTAGVSRHAAGDFDGARAALEEGLVLARRQGATLDEAKLLQNLGATLETLGRWGEALDAYRSAADRFSKRGGPVRRARALSAEAALLVKIGESVRAAEVWSEAAEFFARSGTAPAASGAWRSRAAALSASGELDAAIGALGNALAIDREIGEPERIAATQLAIARAELRAGRLERAEAAAAASRKTAAESLDSRAEAAALTQLIRVELAAGNLDAADELVVAASSRAAAADDPALEADVFSVRARTAARRGELDRAIADNSRSLELIDELSSTLEAEHLAPFTGGAAEVFELQIDLLMRRGRGADAVNALAVRERAAARALAEALRVAGVDNDDQNVGAPSDFGTTLAMLDDDTALLVFALGSERSWAWAVTKEGLVTDELPPRAALERDVRRLVDAVRGGGDWGTTARSLASSLLSGLGPIERYRRLAIVADGALHFLPFGLLESDGRRLIDRYEIVVLPSTDVLAAIRGRPQPEPAFTAAVLADPVFRGDDPRLGEAATQIGPAGASRGSFERLRFSRDEATDVAALVTGDDVFVALDFAASRDTALGDRVAGSRIVHLATHGVIDSGRPERSAVVLSMVEEDGSPTEGFLRLADIWGLDLDAELVVLSGCETALGREIRGVGMIGLSGGFLAAGAESVIASLWTVGDRSTAKLMASFYRGLLEGDGVPPAAALRSAQLELAAEGVPPRDWAAFTVLGDWR